MKTLISFLLMLILVTSADAQTHNKKWGIGAGLGGYGTLNNGGIGLMPEIYLGRYLSPQFDIMLKGDMGLYNSRLVSRTDLANVFLDLRYKLSGEDTNFRPYFYAGPGFLADNRVSALNFNVGIGTKYYFSPAAAFKIDAGYIHGLEFSEYGKTDRDNFWKATIGIEINFGKDKEPEMEPVAVSRILVPEREVKFTVNSPENIPVERKVRETFPLLNYIFFDAGSTEIPHRYVLLRKDQVKVFREDQLEEFAPVKLSERSSRGMVVYYNMLNILGDRMVKNPSSTVTLVGSSEKGQQDGMVMAESVRQYLVNIFDINASRISVEGRDKPKLPSEQPGGIRELNLLREEDRRVSVESSSPALLMEFRSGPAPLKPVEFVAVQETPIDSYVTFNVEGAREALSSWSLEVRDEKGALQEFGPYTQETVSIPGKSIMGTRAKGDFNVTMAGLTKSGKTIKKSVPVKMTLWSPPENEEMMRFSIIYEFDESKAIAIYEKYLMEVVTPKIPAGGSVQIHGYTDIIGDETNNQRLSLARANDVRKIIENSLAKAGRSGVKFSVYGFGEGQFLSPFDNNLPEERFYNRTVIIDIFP